MSHRLCTHCGKSRRALYTRCTTRNDRHGNAALGGEYSAANGTLAYPLCGAVKLHGGWPRTSHRLCTYSGKSRSALYTRCTIQHDAHGNPLLGGEHSAMNGIFVYLLYGPVKHLGGGPGMSPTGFVHILGSPVAPCTLGVRFRMMLMVIHHSAVNTVPSTEFSYTCCTDRTASW